MRKWTNLHNFRRQFFVLSAVACAGLAVASAVVADSGAGLAPAVGTATETGNGIVKGQHSNVRSRPSLNSEVIAQLHKGETVDVLERKTATEREKVMDWLRIALPSTAKCFVNAKHLTDGTVNVDNLNVHCGPGSSYREIGKLPKGARVEVVTKKGEWVQIRPTPECSGWIAAELVDVQPAPRAPASPVNTTENGSEIVTPPVSVSSAPAAPPVSVVNTDPDILVTYVVKDGYVGSVSEANAPASFELRTAEEDRLSFRVAYLETTDTNLKRFVGKHVRIVGTQRWRKGERYPVIALERVDMVW
jgi:uncharacterized protein YgiM (DUF1202 family)